MNSLSVLGKYLDQPALVGKFSRAVPAVLITSGVAYSAYNVHKAQKKEKPKTLTKNLCVMTGTIASALLATRGFKDIKIGKRIIKGFEGLSERIDLKQVALEQTELIDVFLQDYKFISHENTKILNTAREKAQNNKILNPSEIKKLYQTLGNITEGKAFLDRFIPNPENIDSKEIFSEIGRLSKMGLIPVLGGIVGGTIGDKLTDKNWKEKFPNKVKEGAYQYLANIFLCNVGAGAALAAMEKMNIQSKTARAIGMIGGIILTGLVFGSAVANLIGKVCIDPFLPHKNQHIHKHVDLYSERKPEALDMGLHLDDVATVAVMSGLKWIEPALPALYSISGYRAGIGYRNGENK